MRALIVSSVVEKNRGLTYTSEQVRKPKAWFDYVDDVRHLPFGNFVPASLRIKEFTIALFTIVKNSNSNGIVYPRSTTAFSYQKIPFPSPKSVVTRKTLHEP